MRCSGPFDVVAVDAANLQNRIRGRRDADANHDLPEIEQARRLIIKEWTSIHGVSFQGGWQPGSGTRSDRNGPAGAMQKKKSS